MPSGVWAALTVAPDAADPVVVAEDPVVLAVEVVFELLDPHAASTRANANVTARIRTRRIPLLSPMCSERMPEPYRSGRLRPRFGYSMPPSTSRTFPVTNDEAGDARYKAAMAMSSTSPRRFNGV